MFQGKRTIVGAVALGGLRMKGSYEIQEIRARYARGEKKKGIARHMKISRTTVNRYINMPEAEVKRLLDGERRQRASYLDEHKDLIEKIFFESKGNCINIQEVLETKGVHCPLVTLQWYCREKLALRRILKLRQASAALHPARIETDPGNEIQIDFGEKDVLIDGQETRVHFFIGVLGYSRRMYVKFFACENQEAWLAGLEGAFTYFNGVPHRVVCDNARALIRECRRLGQPAVHTQAFAAFCHYWGTRPEACHAYTPQEKGKVERCVRYVKESFLNNFREFKSLQDIQDKFEDWEKNRASQRVILGADGMQFSPEARFKEEQEALRPLLKDPIAGCLVETRKVSVSGCISVSNRLYKLPRDLRNLVVDVLISKEKITVSHNGKTVARLDKQSDAYMPIIRPIELVGQETATGRTLPGSSLDRNIAVYSEAAQ